MPTLGLYLPTRVDLGDAKVAHPISIAAALWAWQSYHLFTFGIGRARHPNLTTSLPTVKSFGVMSSLESGDSDLKENIWIDSATEDELATATKPPRITPRNSLARTPSPTSLNPTPHADVRDPD